MCLLSESFCQISYDVKKILMRENRPKGLLYVKIDFSLRQFLLFLTKRLLKTVNIAVNVSPIRSTVLGNYTLVPY